VLVGVRIMLSSESSDCIVYGTVAVDKGTNNVVHPLPLPGTQLPRRRGLEWLHLAVAQNGRGIDWDTSNDPQRYKGPRMYMTQSELAVRYGEEFAATRPYGLVMGSFGSIGGDVFYRGRIIARCSNFANLNLVDDALYDPTGQLVFDGKTGIQGPGADESFSAVHTGS
jgi:hypothetical protein